MHYIKKAVNYIRIHGIKRFFIRITRFFREKRAVKKYHIRLKPSEKELEAQRKAVFKCMPLISVVIPLYRTKEVYLRALLDSIVNQTYANWEICLADATPTEDNALNSSIKSIIYEYKNKYKQRIKYKAIENKSIAENTNEAIALAEGDFTAFADHDDVLDISAFYEVVKAISNSDGKAEFIYSDEDKVSADGRVYFTPHFKPDFNLDMLRSCNYFCHLVVVKTSLIREAGLLRAEYDGAQDYDLALRLCERTCNIVHIPRILYHWRDDKSSTSFNPDSKKYAYDAGKRALEEHYHRLGIMAEVEITEYPGFYRSRYIWEEQPFVSIIIPNKDHIEDLERCIKSLFDISTYRNFEVIIAENNSVEEDTFKYYEKLRLDYDNIKIVEWHKEFNYPAINNYAVSRAEGEYILLLNNDVELMQECPGFLQEMLSVCMREDVGIVGSRLYYPDGSIQHAGVIVGMRGIAGHAFQGKPHEEMGYFNRAVIMQDLSAVTAACMLVKKSVYEQVGGMDEGFKVAFNDIDFCLRVREAGYLVVYDPYAELIHYESKSRGSEDSKKKIRRFAGEIERFRDRWKGVLSEGDPYYNENLTLESGDYSIRI